LYPPITIMKKPGNPLNNVLKRGKTYNSAHLSLKILTAHKGKTNIFFVVSKRIAKLASRRNLLKRRARAVIIENSGKIRKQHISVLFFRNGSNDLTYQQLKEEILALLNKAGLLAK
jgi:ribonuclease P protein component